MALTDEEFGLVQRYVDAFVEKLAVLNLSFVVERDFGQLITFLRANGAPLVNPTFDPAVSDLSRDAFWLRVVDETGATVASHAQRIFQTDDLCSMMVSGTLWYNDGFKLKEGQDPLQVRRPAMHIAGTIAHAGALWVHPRFRKQGLSLLLPFLSRGLALRNYAPDFFTCIVLTSMGKTALPTMAYGYRHSEPCAVGFIPPANRNDGIYLCYMTLAETIEQFRRLPLNPEHPMLRIDNFRMAEAV
ncbi:MAG TPA: hypothetical protein VF198_00610 [Vicinamibacterales bacterium]